MRTFLKTTNDATLYQAFPLFNSGLDEILEVGKLSRQFESADISRTGICRFLVNFDIISGSYPDDARYFLNLYLANANDVNRYQELLVHPIITPWTEGSGYFYQSPRNVRDGVSWLGIGQNIPWNIPGGGGDFENNIFNSYEFSDHPITDIKIEVTELLTPINSGIVTNWNGLIIKFPDQDEVDESNIGNIKFFSGNTHTIFEPRLEIVWDDQQFITGSLKPIPNSRIKITPKNLKQAYTRGEMDKIYLIVRDLFPDKRFDATQRFKNSYYLPSGSFFRITDEVSGVKLYDFDQFSAINCDTLGSYIKLDTSGLDIDRFYKIELKITTDDIVFFPKFEYIFKVDNDG
jgi:hypothetical protein